MTAAWSFPKRWETCFTEREASQEGGDKIRKAACITAGGNILAGGNISLNLFMAPFETIQLLIS